MSLPINFKPPSAAERRAAIGSTKGLPELLQRALDPGEDFKGIPNPSPGDWLAEHPEEGQTFGDFQKSIRNKPEALRKKIYLQPLGDFPRDKSPSIDILREFAVAYFAIDVVVGPVLAIENSTFRVRLNPLTRNRQILTRDVLALLKTKLPTDAFCTLAITMEDLYPDPAWNFVFGQASLLDRVGVFSFARYDPVFFGEKRGEDYQKVLLRRSCKVLVHETAHMFSLAHCIFFKCVLNGSNHLQESDSRPLWLCPVCLRKLQFSIGFDIADRYSSLVRLYRKIGFIHEARWIAKRLKGISPDEKGKRPSK